MTEKKQEPTWADRDDDELLAQLLPESGSPELTVLTGTFLGRGPEEENALRLYTTMDLSQYFRLPADEVRGVKRLPGGRILVWVPRELRVNLVTSRTASAEFLKGSLQAAYLSRARRTSSFASLARRAVVGDDPQPSVFGGPFCQTDVIDPSNPSCGLTVAGCPPPDQC